MNRALVVLVLAAFLAVGGGFWLAWNAASPGVPEGGGTAPYQPRRPVARQPYVAIGAGLWHPDTAGEGRQALIEWGWNPWIASPPGEAEIGLGYAG